jgi:uncharacterized protein
MSGTDLRQGSSQTRRRSVAGLDPAEQLAIVDLNVRTLVEMTSRFLLSIRSARGKILSVASIAAYFPGGPGMAA